MVSYSIRTQQQTFCLTNRFYHPEKRLDTMTLNSDLLEFRTIVSLVICVTSAWLSSFTIMYHSSWILMFTLKMKTQRVFLSSQKGKKCEENLRCWVFCVICKMLSWCYKTSRDCISNRIVIQWDEWNKKPSSMTSQLLFKKSPSRSLLRGSKRMVKIDVICRDLLLCFAQTLTLISWRFESEDYR